MRVLYYFNLFFLLSFVICSCTNNESSLTLKDSKIPTYNKIAKEQQIKDRLAQEKEMTMDPVTGVVPRKDLFSAQKNMWKQQKEMQQKSEIPNVVWDERGPNNIGGRTRAIMFDPNDPAATKVWAGGVGGGVWYNDDITDANSEWQIVDDFWSNMAVTSIDHDPVDTDVFYVGTGEGFGNLDAIDGDGLWKTTNGGTTWNQLATTTNFNDVNKLVCFKEDGIAVATNNGLRISTNAGASWLTPQSGSFADVEVAANGDLYASNFGGDIYKSTDDGSNWSTIRNGSGSRVELATAPSDSDYVYALITSGNDVTSILKSVNGGVTWASQDIPLYKEQGSCVGGSNVFTRGQGWYDLIAIVSENDPEKVIIGGIDLYRTENGGTNWETISYWTGACDDYVHADQHALARRPGFPNAILNGNDGGIFYASDAFATGSNPNFQERNNEYNVTQFYAVAVHPDNSITNILAGAQDNGTIRLEEEGIGEGDAVTGGDGAFCHIDQDQPNIQITSYVYNNFYVSTNGSNFVAYSLGNSGRFINPTDYDNDANILYACKGVNEYLRVNNVGGSLSNTTISASDFGGQVSCIRVSPNVDNRVYFGINNNGGEIVRVDNANSASPTFTVLDATANGYVSSIDVEVGNEDHILMTISNFNLTSVWESTDGGTNFSSVEGDLPNMPVRWGIFDPNASSQAILATELGVWTTTMLNGALTDWNPTNTGLANTRVDMIEYRTSDNFMVAGTHGRGVFTSTSFNLGCNIAISNVGDQVCDPQSNTYTQDLDINLSNTPSSGQLSVNGELFTIPFDQESASISITMTGLTADAQGVDVTMFFTADNSCEKTFSGLFTAANPGCIDDNINCANALPLFETGTHTSNGPADGDGCNNCSSSTHADWYKFTAPSNGTISIQSCGYAVDTRLWLYSGSCESLIAVDNSDDDCILGGGSTNNWAAELVDIEVTAGTTYFWEWDNRWNTSAVTFDFTFEGTSSPCDGLDHRFVDESLVVSGDGCTWATAYNNLQDAIDGIENEANVNSLWLREGTYKPGNSGVTINRNTTLNISATTSIYGGFDGTEITLGDRDPLNNITILSGDVGLAEISSDNSYHVFTHDSPSAELTLDGLQIIKGNNNLDNTGGAGVYNLGQLTMTDCIIRDHLSSGAGSGITNTGANALLTISGTDFSSNAGIECRNGNGAEIIIPANTSVDFQN